MFTAFHDRCRMSYLTGRLEPTQKQSEVNENAYTT